MQSRTSRPLLVVLWAPCITAPERFFCLFWMEASIFNLSSAVRSNTSRLAVNAFQNCFNVRSVAVFERKTVFESKTLEKMYLLRSCGSLKPMNNNRILTTFRSAASSLSLVTNAFCSIRSSVGVLMSSGIDMDFLANSWQSRQSCWTANSCLSARFRCISQCHVIADSNTQY